MAKATPQPPVQLKVNGNIRFSRDTMDRVYSTVQGLSVVAKNPLESLTKTNSLILAATENLTINGQGFERVYVAPETITEQEKKFHYDFWGLTYVHLDPSKKKVLKEVNNIPDISEEELAKRQITVTPQKSPPVALDNKAVKPTIKSSQEELILSIEALISAVNKQKQAAVALVESSNVLEEALKAFASDLTPPVSSEEKEVVVLGELEFSPPTPSVKNNFDPVPYISGTPSLEQSELYELNKTLFDINIPMTYLSSAMDRKDFVVPFTILESILYVLPEDCVDFKDTHEFYHVSKTDLATVLTKAAKDYGIAIPPDFSKSAQETFSGVLRSHKSLINYNLEKFKKGLVVGSLSQEHFDIVVKLIKAVQADLLIFSKKKSLV